MPRENEFEPRLGKIRSLGSKRGRKYLHQVLAAANLAGRSGKVGSGFHGNRIGRGCGIGRVLASRDSFAAYRQRRVIIKSRIVRLAGKGAAGARAHLRYIQRDGVTRDGEPGTLYGRDKEAVDGKAFHDRSASDHHQFRFIVSPEDGGDYESLRPLTRRLMAQMEVDLGTRLDWVAVDHFNTGHPHAHIMLRGVDEQGRDLVIARDYLSTGMRERAAELVDLDLGPRTDAEIERRLMAEVEQERLTSLDRQLIGAADDSGCVSPKHRSSSRQTLLAGRLGKLEALGLAEEIAPGRWQLAGEVERTLRRLGERGDIIKTMNHELGGKARAGAELAIFDAAEATRRPVVGRVLSRGLSDELSDRHFLIVEGVDGRTHYIDIGKGDALEPLPCEAIVRIEARQVRARAADRTIAEVAAANGGTYSIDFHLRHDPRASQAFAVAHVRRLEAMRRAGAQVARHANGSWTIAADHLHCAEALEREQVKGSPVKVEILSRQPLECLPQADGATWLDQELVRGKPEALRDSGFGRAVREAQQARRQWLIERGFGAEKDTIFLARPGMIEELRRRDLVQAGRQLEKELGLRYHIAQEGERVEGRYIRSVDRSSGRFAIVECGRDFTLVPWRPVLEGQQGNAVRGIVRGEAISWSIGRSKSGPSV